MKNIIDEDIVTKMKEICEKIEGNEKIFQIEPKILLKYLNLQDSIPFDLYLKNALYRILMKKKSNAFPFIKEKDKSYFYLVNELKNLKDKSPQIQKDIFKK